MLNKWNQYWFSSDSALGLGIFRSFFYFWMLVTFAFAAPSAQPHYWAHIPEVFWNPIPLFQLFSIPRISPAASSQLEVIWFGALILASLGLATRASTAVAAVLALYLLGLRYSVGFIYATNGILTVASLILALSRCGDSFSLDALLRKRYSRATVKNTACEPGDYSWPLRLVQTCFLLLFFFSGVNKLLVGGLAWITTDNLRNKLILRLFHVSESYWHHPGINLTLALIQHPLLCKFIAGFVVTIQLCTPLALIYLGWPRYLLLFLLASMQVGIYFTLGLNYFSWAPLYLAFLPWEKIFSHFANASALYKPQGQR